MSDNKTHYRKVFKSDHLGVADLEEFLEEGKRLVFTVTHVNQEFGVMVAGRKGDHNIAYFKENIKPLVLNSINSKRMKEFNDSSPFVEDWGNTLIELYIDKGVKLMGDVVGGVRISPTRPTVTKPELTPESDKWDGAVTFLMGDGKIEQITKSYSLSEENMRKLIEASTNDKS